MVKRVAILANGGDVSGFNAVIRAIIKTAEKNNIECYGFVDEPIIDPPFGKIPDALLLSLVLNLTKSLLSNPL